MRAEQPLQPSTLAVTAGRGAGRPGEPVNVPVTLTSIYRGGEEPPEYARASNPTWTALEEVIGSLEGGTAVAFASGIAAIDAVLELLPAEAVVVAPHDAYAGARGLLADLAERGRLRVRLVDIADTAATLAACDEASLLLLESPTNPLMAMAEVPELVEGAHARGALTAFDNTFATPLRHRPLDAGVDVVVHSATKLLAGHADVLLGAAVTRDEELGRRLVEHRTSRGAIPGPMEAWLTLRGVRTLPVRLDRGEASASTLAERLHAHPAVHRVRYPGLAGDPGFERARRQLRGPGVVLSVELADAASADAVCRNVAVAVHATSLGGVETTLERRARQPHELHLPEGLVRISVGCEDVEDLWEDLVQALAVAVPEAR